MAPWLLNCVLVRYALIHLPENHVFTKGCNAIKHVFTHTNLAPAQAASAKSQGSAAMVVPEWLRLGLLAGRSSLVLPDNYHGLRMTMQQSASFWPAGVLAGHKGACGPTVTAGANRVRTLRRQWALQHSFQQLIRQPTAWPEAAHSVPAKGHPNRGAWACVRKAASGKGTQRRSAWSRLLQGSTATHWPSCGIYRSLALHVCVLQITGGAAAVQLACSSRQRCRWHPMLPCPSS